MAIQDILTDVDGNRLHYRNDNMLRPAETKIALTEEHVKEYLKCKNDLVYFAENYVHIQDPNEGRTLIKLYDYQKEMLRHFAANRFNIIMSSRQMGKCLTFWTKIKVRNTKSGKPKIEFIGMFYLKQYLRLKIKNLFKVFL